MTSVVSPPCRSSASVMDGIVRPRRATRRVQPQALVDANGDGPPVAPGVEEAYRTVTQHRAAIGGEALIPPWPRGASSDV